MVDLVNELTQRVQCSVTGIGPQALERLYLVENEDKSAVTSTAQNRQQPSEKRKGAIVVEVAADTGGSLH